MPGTHNHTVRALLLGRPSVPLVGMLALSALWACSPAHCAPARPAGAAANVHDFGARGDGKADDTAAIQAAFDAGKPVYFPAGTYRVRMNRLTLRDGSRLLGEGRLSRIQGFDQSDNQWSLLRAVGRSDITVDSLCFETPRSTQTALLFASCANVTVTRCHAVNCQLAYIGSSAVAALHDIGSANAFFDIYDHVKGPEHYSRRILIEGNTCVGDGTPAKVGGGLAGIFISFAENVRVVNNDVSRYLHGIMWWGGNANTQGPVPNGDPARVRKCRGLTISGNAVHNVLMGGIWGAMGERVAVAGNTVTDCGDVGIDFEGCVDSAASGNTVADCKSACLCTVFDNRGIVFSGNACAQHTPGWWIAAVMNQHHSNGNESVSFTGNSFTSHRGLSAVVSQGVRRLVFQGNILRNVAVSFSDPSLNHSGLTICSNDLLFDAAAEGSADGLLVGPLGPGGHTLVQGNSVTSRATQPAGSAGIHVLASSTSAERHLITGNVVSGWNPDVLVDTRAAPTAGAAQRHLFSLQGNCLESLSVKQTPADSANVVCEGNHKADGGVVR